MCDLDECALGITVKQDVGVRVDKHRAAHGVGPIIVLGDAPEACLDATNNDRCIVIGFAAALTVDDYRTVGAFACLGMRCVGVVVTEPEIRSIAIDQRVHVAAGDAEE